MVMPKRSAKRLLPIRFGAFVLAVFMILIGGVIRPGLVTAQQPTPPATQNATPSACQQLLPLIQESIKSSCNGMDRDQVCYAHKTVTVELASGTDKVTFSKVGDIVPLKSLKSLTTAPYSSASDNWGLAVLKVQAQVPNTTAGQAVTFILYGDAKLENASKDAGSSAPKPTTTCKATTTRATSLVPQPGITNVAKRLPSDTEVIVQGRSQDSAWILAQSETVLGWVKADNIKSDCNLSALPMIDPSKPSVMPGLRAFYFSTGISGQATCADAASGMMIQSPSGSQVSFNVNGADMTIGSSIVLRAVPHQKMKVQVIRGHASVQSKGKTQTITDHQQLELDLGGADGWEVESEPSDPEEITGDDTSIGDACALAEVAGEDNPCDPATAPDEEVTPSDGKTDGEMTTPEGENSGEPGSEAPTPEDNPPADNPPDNLPSDSGIAVITM